MKCVWLTSVISLVGVAGITAAVFFRPTLNAHAITLITVGAVIFGVIVLIPILVSVFRYMRAITAMAEQGSDSDSIVLPHKTTPQIAIISGSIALLVAVVGLTMTLREVALGPGPILSYAATGFFGVVSLTLGLLLLKRRSEVLAFYRLNWLRVENDYLYFSTGAYTAQMKLFDLHRQRMIDLIEQRDALVASGYLTDADRVTEVLRFISQSLPSKPPTPKY